MARDFRSSDEGKRVVNEDGDEVGTIDSIDGDTAHVRPKSGLTQQMRQRLGWEDEDEDSYPLRQDRVDDISDDEVRLKS